MSVSRIRERPGVFREIPDCGYCWYSLRDEKGEYAVAGVARRGDALELHLEVECWNLRTARNLRRDMEWLKEYARETGARRIVGLRSEGSGRPDLLWPKFTRMFGFRNQALVQVASLELK